VQPAAERRLKTSRHSMAQGIRTAVTATT
jgi:hypothetical protein